MIKKIKIFSKMNIKRSRVFPVGEILSDAEVKIASKGRVSNLRDASIISSGTHCLDMAQNLFNACQNKLKKLQHQTMIRGDVFLIAKCKDYRYRNDSCFMVKDENTIEELHNKPDDYGTLPLTYTLNEFHIEYFLEAVHHNSYVVLPAHSKDLLVFGNKAWYKEIPILGGDVNNPKELKSVEIESLINDGPLYLSYEKYINQKNGPFLTFSYRKKNNSKKIKSDEEDEYDSDYSQYSGEIKYTQFKTKKIDTSSESEED